MDSFTTQYIAAALWTSVDDDDTPLTTETYSRMAADCALFQDKAGDLIDAENLREPDNDAKGAFGHDFWLTRNGHGTGFWDGDYTEPAATELTKLSKWFGPCDLIVGDDGKLHIA